MELEQWAAMTAQRLLAPLSHWLARSRWPVELRLAL
jgi:hypothetical protein